MKETEPEKSITNNQILLNSIINSIDVLADYACTVFIYLLFGKLGSSTEHQEEKMVVIKLWWFVVNEWPCYHS